MIVITAASGRLGKAVAEELAMIVPVDEIRLAARTLEKLDEFKRRGFAVVKGDYDDRRTLDAAFDGADTVLLISGAGPNEVRTRQHRDAVAAAKKAGVTRIVYTSVVNPSPESQFIWARPHYDTEACLKSSGMDYTILRDNPYAANLDDLLVHAVDQGVLAFPGAEGKVAYVTHNDIAAAAAQVLTGQGHANKVYHMTGPESVTGVELAEMLSHATGREVECVNAEPDAFRSMFRSMGFPEFVIEGLISFYQASGAGEYSTVSSDIETLTGRPPKAMQAYIEALFSLR